MRRFLIRTAILTSCAFLSMLGGCLGGSSPSRFYLLSPLPASESPAKVGGVAIGVGPISLPNYLDRSQIVTRKGENQLQLAEFDRWAESLQRNFTRVLLLNLSTLLATDRMALHPWNRSTPIDYQVTVDVARFEAGTDEKISLLARWSIIDGGKQGTLRMRKSIFSEPIASEGYEATVESMSRAVASLSREIAEAIHEVSASRQRAASEE